MYDISNDSETQMGIEKYPVIEEFMCSCHGSGIDYEWYAVENKGYIVLTNSYHSMNDCGMYDAVIDFSVTIPKTDILNFDVKCLSNRYYWNKYGLKEYLEDTIHYGLTEAINTLKDQWPIKSGIRQKEIWELLNVKKEGLI